MLGLKEGSSIIGMARLSRQLVTGEDQSPLWAGLHARFSADPSDADALFDMSMLLRLTGKMEQSAVLQTAALDLRTCFTCVHGSGLKVLVFVTSADVMSNAPIDFLCEGSDFTLHFLHMDAAATVDVPEHDVAFVATGQSEANRPVLDRLGPLLAAWPKPVMNAQCKEILSLTRDGTSAMFPDAPEVLAPTNLLVQRTTVEALAEGRLSLGGLRSEFAYPMLVRPVETHGGKGLEKIDRASNLSEYLERFPEEQFFMAPFIDYSSADGLFRKLRITFIDGVPFATHMAVSEHWLVHYISAGMLNDETKRAEESAWMQRFDEDFAVRHAQALTTIASRIGIDYFSIDCAETPDGRLLLFEADVASIVHALDPEEIFPYKRAGMKKLFGAFRHALERRAAVNLSEDLSAAA